jgi:hypothetical protein
MVAGEQRLPAHVQSNSAGLGTAKVRNAALATAWWHPASS